MLDVPCEPPHSLSVKRPFGIYEPTYNSCMTSDANAGANAVGKRPAGLVKIRIDITQLHPCPNFRVPRRFVDAVLLHLDQIHHDSILAQTEIGVRVAARPGLDFDIGINSTPDDGCDIFSRIWTDDGLGRDLDR